MEEAFEKLCSTNHVIFVTLKWILMAYEGQDINWKTFQCKGFCLKRKVTVDNSNFSLKCKASIFLMEKKVGENDN